MVMEFPSSPPKLPEPVYLGDGLYADFDGYQIELYASNGMRKTNQIYLEPRVLEAFYRYAESVFGARLGR